MFELVKNAYDADASTVAVQLRNPADARNGSIVVLDDGTGMTVDTIVNVWLQPGTDFREQQRNNQERTPRFKRLPLGEKGIGRFAVHKLGRIIDLITRANGSPEIHVHVDWRGIEHADFLSEFRVSITENQSPQVFKNGKTGTRITVSELNEAWNRGMARNASRAVTALRSPFELEGEFKARLTIEPQSEWLDGLLDAAHVLEHSLFKAKGRISGDSVEYDYEFTPYPAMDKVAGRRVTRTEILPESKPDDGGPPKRPNLTEVGNIEFDIRLFDRQPAVMALGVQDRKGLGDFLNRYGGVRVYRDGMRVYDYGEPGNDWLGLDAARIQRPVQRIGNNIVIGAVYLDLDSSRGLQEKTNREGFVENDAYKDFKNAVGFAIRQIAAERNEDKRRIREAYSRDARVPVIDSLAEVRDRLEEKGEKDLLPLIDRAESDYVEMRELLLTSAGAGLSLVVVIHEIEKRIKELSLAIEQDADKPRLERLATDLAGMIDGLTYLTRRSGRASENARDLVNQAIFNNSYRLENHGVNVLNAFHDGAGFDVPCTRRLILSTLTNLIDNSIFWLDVRWGHKSENKHLWIGPARDIEGGPAIVVADNGTGLDDPPALLVEPFTSRKPDGMGLGLHIAHEVMLSHKGRLAFPDRAELGIPDRYDGAVVALAFEDPGT
ncbi:MAG: ATP-binding protein [Chloroflexota bacterium]|nr:ATP-binding protein [Chloroflexota bacterium]